MKITIIVAQQTHHTRFALAQVNASGRKPTWNVPSGTVVDNTIVEPLYKTFYLNSHFSPLVSVLTLLMIIFSNQFAPLPPNRAHLVRPSTSFFETT